MNAILSYKLSKNTQNLYQFGNKVVKFFRESLKMKENEHSV